MQSALANCVSEILQLVEVTDFLRATCFCRHNGRMECWNAGILGARAKINHFNCKKLLQTHHFYPVKLFSISPGPLFPPGRRPSRPEANWGEAPKFVLHESPVRSITTESSEKKHKIPDMPRLFFRTVYRTLGIDASFTFISSQSCAQNDYREKVDNQQTRL